MGGRPGARRGAGIGWAASDWLERVGRKRDGRDEIRMAWFGSVWLDYVFVKLLSAVPAICCPRPRNNNYSYHDCIATSTRRCSGSTWQSRVYHGQEDWGDLLSKCG